MNFLVAALGVLPTYVWLVLGAGVLVLLGAALYIVGRVVLGASDEPARRLTRLLLATGKISSRHVSRRRGPVRRVGEHGDQRT